MTMHQRTGRGVFRISPASAAVALAVLAGLTVPTTAHAYIDPGSGTLIWQAVLAALFGGMFYIRRIVNALKTWMGVGRAKGAGSDT